MVPPCPAFPRAERHHRWVSDRIAELEAPLLVCEPVLAEAMYLLARLSRAQDALLELLENPDKQTPIQDACSSSGSGARVPLHQRRINGGRKRE